MGFTVELACSPILRDRKEAYSLYRDWLMARARLWGELVMKMWYWRQLPWALIGISHHSPEKSIEAAKRCVKLFENPNCNEAGKSHKQSQRFLNPSYIGDSPSDKPLRPLVDKLIDGYDLASEEMRPLTAWLSKLSTIRVAERSVEGIHSIITKVYKRAPAAKMPYVSLELRMEDVINTVTNSPSDSNLNNQNLTGLDMKDLLNFEF